MPDRIIGLPIFLDPNESLLYTTMPDASSESAFELESETSPKDSSKSTTPNPRDEKQQAGELKRAPTLRRQIIAPPPLPPIHPATSPLMTRRQPKIPPCMPSSFVPSSSTMGPSRQTSYHERSSSAGVPKRNKNKCSHAHHRGPFAMPVQPVPRNSYNSSPVIYPPKPYNHRPEIYSNRFYDRVDRYEVKPLIYTGFNRVTSPVNHYSSYQQLNAPNSRFNMLPVPNQPPPAPAHPPQRPPQPVFNQRPHQPIYQPHQLPMNPMTNRPFNNINHQQRQQSMPQNPPIYQRLPQNYSSGVYATQNQIYSNLQPQPPPIYCNFSSLSPEYNMIEQERYLMRHNIQGEAAQSSDLNSMVMNNPHQPKFGGLSKRLKNVFHGFKIN